MKRTNRIDFLSGQQVSRVACYGSKGAKYGFKIAILMSFSVTSPEHIKLLPNFQVNKFYFHFIGIGEHKI